MPPLTLPTVIMFTPNQWDYIDKLSRWLGKPFTDIKNLKNSLEIIREHRDKFITSYNIAIGMIPELHEERLLLHQRGYTNGAKSQGFTCLIETLILELYACLDGLKESIHALYNQTRGVQKKSTDKLFKNSIEGKYGEGFPEEINDLLKKAYLSWFPELRSLRTELTHGRVGQCSMQKKLLIEYNHKCSNIENIIDWININAENVGILLNKICEFWFKQLEQREVVEYCGIHEGRFIIRSIIVEDSVNQDSGLCLFRHSFEEDSTWMCPLRDSCGAYKRVGSNSREALERMIAEGKL